MIKILTINCDGGSRGNPGPAASAFTITDSTSIIFEQGKFIGINTNNQAEYYGVIFAFQWLKDHSEIIHKYSQINIYLDSLLVVNQLNGIFKIKDLGLQKLFSEIQRLKSLLASNQQVIFNHIPRENNSRADLIVNQTLDKNLHL